MSGRKCPASPKCPITLVKKCPMSEFCLKSESLISPMFCQKVPLMGQKDPWGDTLDLSVIRSFLPVGLILNFHKCHKKSRVLCQANVTSLALWSLDLVIFWDYSLHIYISLLDIAFASWSFLLTSVLGQFLPLIGNFLPLLVNFITTLPLLR